MMISGFFVCKKKGKNGNGVRILQTAGCKIPTFRYLIS